MKRYEKMTKVQIVEALADAGNYDWIMDEVTPRPEPGEKFNVGGVTFVALGEEQGGLGSSKIDVLCADHPACYAITTESKVDVWILEE